MRVWLLERLASLGLFAQNKLLPAVIVAALGILLTQLVLRLVSATLRKTNMEQAGHKLIKSVVRIVLYLLLGLMVASSLGIDVTGVVALASVLTLAISLALQNVLTNVFGGITLLYSKSFHKGDYVEIASRSGTVEEIGLTYTKLITPDNKLISIPNSAVVAAEIVNYTTTGTRRLEITFSAPYSAPVEQVISALLAAAQQDTVLLDSPEPFAGVQQYTETGVQYVLRAWSKGDLFWNNYYTIQKNIPGQMQQRGIDAPYSHLHIHLAQETEK